MLRAHDYWFPVRDTRGFHNANPDFAVNTEVREGQAIYYIAEFKFINEEWRFFEVDFRPGGADETYTFKFKHQLYIN